MELVGMRGVAGPAATRRPSRPWRPACIPLQPSAPRRRPAGPIRAGSPDDPLKGLDPALLQRMAALERESSSPARARALESATRRRPSPSPSPTAVAGRPSFPGVNLLLALNIGLFVADHVAKSPAVASLYLNHVHPQWFQFVTSTFCHASYAHLSSNLFFLYVFGKLVEEEEGPAGVVLSYLATGLGASLASYWMLPATTKVGLIGTAAVTSLGASGAVFGLFAVAALLKLRWDLVKLVEFGILGQFVVSRVMSEVQMAGAGGGVGAGGVNHVAHIAGALAGVVLIAALRQLLPPDAPGGR